MHTSLTAHGFGLRKKPSILNPKYFQKFEVHPSVILRGGIQHSCLWYIYNYQSSLSFGWLLVLKHTFEALKIILQSPLILTPLQGCALCSLAFPLTLFFKGVWHLWKCVLMVEGESSGSRGRWSPFSPVVRDAKGLFVSCPVVRGVLKGKPQMTTSFGWTKVGALSCNCSHSN